MPEMAWMALGLIYSIIVWAASMVIYVPIVYKGGLFAVKFGKSVRLGNLLAHIVYGIVLGVAC